MTSPDRDTPTTPGWAAPTGGQPEGLRDEREPAGPAGPPPGAPAYPSPYPGYGAPGYGPSGGYRPPAVQPGIVPLRPLGLGEILDGAFRAIRANPRVMFGLTALVVTITVALQTLVQWYVGGLLTGPIQDVTGQLDPTGNLGLTEALAPAVSQLFTFPALTLATTVLTGLLTVAVSRSVLGQTITIGEVWSTYRGRVGVVLVFTVLFAIAITLVLGAFVAVVIVAVTNWAQSLAITLGLVGGALVLVAEFWLLVRTLLIPAAIMLEGAGLSSAIRRGWTLTRGSYWRLLGIYLLTSIIVGVVSAIITVPAGLIASFVAHGDATAVSSLVISAIANIIALTMTTVFTAAVVALLYIDVRMRREGLDVELARAAGEPVA